MSELRCSLSRCCCALRWPAAPMLSKPVGFYRLENRRDFSIKVTNWGATLVSVLVPDCQGMAMAMASFFLIQNPFMFHVCILLLRRCYISVGNSADVILRYDTLAGYVNGTGSFGATVGRVVNRIAKSRFVLDGKAYRLFRNDGNNSIHGGHRGFGKVIWTVKEYVRDGDTPYITFFYHSFDGEQADLHSFRGPQDSRRPGRVRDVPALRPLRPQHPDERHGHEQGDAGEPRQPRVLEPRRPRQRRRPGHELQLLASRYTPLDDTKIPTGQVVPVAGTMYDFRTPTPVGAHMDIVPGGGGGYDINFVVDGQQDAMRKVACVRDPESGGRWSCGRTSPGAALHLQLGQQREGQSRQGVPDAVNHPEFPSSIVRPGQVYKHNMLFKFSN
ncbi:hypothetical protein ZWY2020_024642 [Hordeum vulgare]|nr:hypothetical protein ZWY2020_024642 [Hordeum vulgare]